MACRLATLQHMDRPLPTGYKNKKRIRLALLTGSVCLLIWVLFNALDDSGTVKVKREQLMIGTVVREAFTEYILAEGILVPLRTIHLDATEGGVVEQKLVNDGDQVKAGQPLLVFSNTTLETELMNREELLNNEKNLLLQADYTRSEKLIELEQQTREALLSLNEAKRLYLQDSLLFRDQLVSVNELEGSRQRYFVQQSVVEVLQKKKILEESKGRHLLEQYRASVLLKERHRQLAAKNVASLTLCAPASGQLSGFKAEAGEYKVKGQKLGELDMANGFKIKASVDEYYLSRMYPGQKAVAVVGGKEYALELVTIYPQVLQGHFEADFIFTDALPQQVNKGQTFSLRIATGTSEATLLLPKGIFYEESGGGWVFVLSPDGTFAEKRKVKLGKQNHQYYQVMEGLKAGERVIISSCSAFAMQEKLRIQ